MKFYLKDSSRLLVTIWKSSLFFPLLQKIIISASQRALIRKVKFFSSLFKRDSEIVWISQIASGQNKDNFHFLDKLGF